MLALELATEVVRKLVQEGYVAYFVGGWVRDHVMGHPSSDIDIATNAKPEIITDLFPKTICVGIAFGSVVVVQEGHHFEVSTFREDIEYEDGRRPKKIAYTTAEEDAKRRDFTINGMFYDPLTHAIIDFVQGMEDIQKKVIRAIGDPFHRFSEDRLRMIRAVRFAARFEFHMDSQTQEAIKKNANTLFPAVAMERVWQEFTKITHYPHADNAFIELHRLGLLTEIFPAFQNVTLNEIKERVAPFSRFPKTCPTILYIMELFPEASLKELIGVCQHLKVSNRDAKMVEFAHHSRHLLQDESKDDVAWAHFFGHPSASLILDVYAAKLADPATFYARHENRKQRLSSHIARVAQKTPLVTAAELQKHNIFPGKQMGTLLAAAERIAIEQNCDDSEKVIALLKQTPHWPHH